MKKILLPVLSNLFCATALGAIPVILGLILATPSQAQTNSTAALDVPTVEPYKLALEIDPEHHSLSGQADISSKNSGQRSLTTDTISEDYSLLRAESMPYPIIGLPSHVRWRKSFQNKFD